MAKKKTSKPIASAGFGVKSLAPELQKALALIDRKQWQEARLVLEPLSKIYPKNVEVWELLVNLYIDLNNLVAYTQACERVLELDPKNAEAAYGLGGGYISCLHPLLALQAFKHALDRFPRHEGAARAKSLVAELEGSLNETLAKMGLEGEDGKAIAILHEKGQVYLERGDYDKARQTEEEVLRLKPDFISAFNNLCLICFAEGDISGAIALAQDVLEKQPDNIHALSNLVRFHFLNGEQEQARQYGDRLKASQAEAWDRWTKKAEGLSYLADDEGVLEVFEQAKSADDLSITSALFHHLVAVAMERLGQSKQAKEQWKKSLERSPGFPLAKENLEDLKRPVGQRNAPWAFGLNYWINRGDIDALQTTLRSTPKSRGDVKLSQAIQRYLNDRPYLAKLIPVLLERSDSEGREFAFRLASMAKTPEMLEALRSFALSQSGTDQLRYEAAIKVSEAGLLPPGNVQMWMKGQWQEVMLIAYEFHDEPPYWHSKEVEKLLKESLTLLNQRTPEAAKQAEQLLKKAIELEPDFPDLQNNLAVAYQQQKRLDECKELIRYIAEKYPNYVTARASLAKLLMNEKNIEAADELLKPLLSQQRYHIDDFAAFSDAYMQLLIAKKQTQGAKTWLNVWEQLGQDHPQLRYWQARLKKGNPLGELLNILGK